VLALIITFSKLLEPIRIITCLFKGLLVIILSFGFSF